VFAVVEAAAPVPPSAAPLAVGGSVRWSWRPRCGRCCRAPCVRVSWRLPRLLLCALETEGRCGAFRTDKPFRPCAAVCAHPNRRRPSQFPGRPETLPTAFQASKKTTA
jgi:hypothetical protein